MRVIEVMLCLFSSAPKEGVKGNPGACGDGLSPLLFMVIIFAIFYFLFIRPSQIQQKKHKEMINSLQKGDKVITSCGIHGRITQIKDTTVKLKVDEKTEIELEKNMIRVVLKKED